MSDVPHLFAIEELPLITSDESRADVGPPALAGLSASAGKRNIRLAYASQTFQGIHPAIRGNVGCLIITGLANPACVSMVSRVYDLSPAQAGRLAALGPREAFVHIADHPTPFLVRVDEIHFADPPDVEALEGRAERFLDEVDWTEDDLQETAGPKLFEPPSSEAPLTANARKLFARLAEHPAETTEDQCLATGLNRQEHLDCIKQFDAKGLVEEVDVKVGKVKFRTLTSKGYDLAKRLGLKAKRYAYKSGMVHEFILREIERAIGALSPKFSFSRNSPIGREQKRQPDSVLHMPGGRRAIIEVVCHNASYDARNLVQERRITGVDLVIAVAANAKLRNALRRTVDRVRTRLDDDRPEAPLHILTAGAALKPDFDWTSVLERPAGAAAEPPKPPGEQ